MADLRQRPGRSDIELRWRADANERSDTRIAAKRFSIAVFTRLFRGTPELPPLTQLWVLVSPLSACIEGSSQPVCRLLSDEKARLRFRLPLMERCAPGSSGDVSNNRLRLKTGSQHLPKALNEAGGFPGWSRARRDAEESEEGAGGE